MSEFRLSVDIPNDLSQNYNTKCWGGAGQSPAHCRGGAQGCTQSTPAPPAPGQGKISWNWLHLSGAASPLAPTDNVHAKGLFGGDSQPKENAQPMELDKATQTPRA